MGSLDLFKLIIAIIPIIWLLVSIGKLNIPSHIASGVALLVSLLSAWIIFKMPPVDLFQASAEGVMLAWHPILLVIISALFVYNITVATGSMDKIKNMLVSISPDRRIQTLILAFGFGGFLEAVAGFGTAVAIPAGIMAAMGFNPLTAAIVCLVANTVPVAFGVLGGAYHYPRTGNILAGDRFVSQYGFAAAASDSFTSLGPDRHPDRECEKNIRRDRHIHRLQYRFRFGPIPGYAVYWTGNSRCRGLLVGSGGDRNLGAGSSGETRLEICRGPGPSRANPNDRPAVGPGGLESVSDHFDPDFFISCHSFLQIPL